MRRSLARRVSAVAGGVLAAVTLLALAGPVQAQVPVGTQATAYVGGPVAACPVGSPGAVAPASATINGVTVNGAGRCTPLAADAEGDYSLGGMSPLSFTASCTNVNGTVQHGGGVEVPTGTIVNGVAVAGPTTITAENASVIFPGGRRATLNVVTTTPTSLTRTAIVFEGGPAVGRVVCGAAAIYPLAVDPPGASDATPAVAELPPGDGDGGGVNLALLGAGALVVVLLAQVVVGRRIHSRRVR